MPIRNDHSWIDRSYFGFLDVMDLKEAMAINLRRIRSEKRLTQEELAHLAKLSSRYIGSVERADVSASVTVLGQIAEALSLEPEELLRKPLKASTTFPKSARKGDF